MYVQEDGEQSLADAERRLSEFEVKAFAKHRMARFRKESPNHPILLGMVLCAGLAFLSGFGGIGLALAPLVSASLARTLAATPLLAVAPVAMLGTSMVFATLWVGLRVLASARAANSPLLPRDQSEHNRLRSDVQRLRAAREVQKRLSATPPPARVRRSY